MTQVYTKRFQCQYNFQLYPFDTQTCTIRMDTSADDLNIVRLHPGKMALKETSDLNLFEVKSWSLVSMQMKLKRKVMNELLTTFLPSIFLMIITFATTFFKPFFFEAALSVNLTTMLMMTTISIGKMQTLPTTAYVRMIDVWLVFCQLVPFAEVILITALECYRDRDAEMIVEPVKHIFEPLNNETRILANTMEELMEGENTVGFKNCDFGDTSSAFESNLEQSSKRRLVQLKVLGWLTRLLKVVLIVFYLSERKILPSIVIMFSLAYFGMAALFYLI